jgi:hypothetical protein
MATGLYAGLTGCLRSVRRIRERYSRAIELLGKL